jgi:phosphoserine phosphatase RsbU/P
MVNGAQDEGEWASEYRDRYERAPCGLLTTAADGTIVAVNNTFVEWIGYDRQTLLDRQSFSGLLSGGSRIYHETHYAPTLQMQGTAREIAFDVVCADGSRLPVLVNAVARFGPNAAIDTIEVAVFAATDRRQYERELLAAKQRAEASEVQARRLAHTLQRTLIPHSIPQIVGLDVAVAFRPAGDGHELGGDFYDVFQIGTNDWILAIGDVEGKGIEAAIVTALARHTIRAAAVEHDQPSKILHLLNDVLVRDNSERFCTVAIIRCRRVDGVWRLISSCAGHPPPLLVRPPAPPVEIARAGTLAGFLLAVEFSDTELVLQPGDTVVAYTDGVTEARLDDHFFGEGRLHDALARTGPDQSAEGVASGLLDEVVRFQHGFTRDDVAILVVRR